ncbi:MAG TPA: serine/threonine protein kinase [Casimicrobiaceae bacterium]|nr:serine/threonine protein kinase [Casimicrobiaceae bacterium]
MANNSRPFAPRLSHGETQGSANVDAPSSNDAVSIPYAGLTPDLILDALDSVGIRGDGRLLSLNSYENRVYQVYRDDEPPVIVKFYRPARFSDAQILEEHRFVRELADSEVPAVAPMAFVATTLPSFAGFRFAAYPRCGGRAPALEQTNVLTQLGRYIARIHTVGAARAFEHRPALTVEAFGDASRSYLLEHDSLPAELRIPWTSIVDLALAAIHRAFTAVTFTSIRLHGDCHGGNVLWTDAGAHFVDFDDARMGPAVQDLWMLLAGERAAMETQLAAVLEGYESFGDFDRRELALIEPLRTLRLLHYSAWIARRWDDPAFPAAFPWFGTNRYWQDRILELREQVALMDEPPLRA